MAITDCPVNIDSSPSTTSGRSSGFSQLGRGFGAAAVCSAIAAFLSRDASGRELCRLSEAELGHVACRGGDGHSRAHVARGAARCRSRRGCARVSARFQLALIPERAPDLRRGAQLYQQACAACHGADGTPRVAHLQLTTQPTAFSATEQVARLSPQRVFSAVTFGVPGTAMPSFSDALDDAARWDLAFAVLLFAHRPEERRRGEELVRKLPRRPDWLQLAVRSDDQLRAALQQSPFSTEDREAVIAAVRASFADVTTATA